MIKLKPLLKEYKHKLQGEWWIHDGQAIYADGDVGDMNHEAHVIDLLRRDVLDELGVEIDTDHVDVLGEYLDQIYENIKDDLNDKEKNMWENEDYNDVIISYLKRNGSKDIEEKIKYTEGFGDSREYALKNWGWKRVKQNIIQTQTLTTKDLKNITIGLYDAYGDELEETNEEDITEENPLGEHTFDLEVNSTRSFYKEIPWSILAKDDPTKLNLYRTRYE